MKNAAWSAKNEAINKLLHRVQYGDLTPEKAEELARENGLKLREDWPKDKFDPLKQIDWSLPMAVAWIAWRDIDRVRDHSAEYLAECLEWRSHDDLLPAHNGKGTRERTGYDLFPRRAVTLLQMDQNPEAETAREELWEKLRAGEISATAIDADTGSPLTVPAIDWSRLYPETDENSLRDLVRFANETGPEKYRNLLIAKSDILKTWPPAIPTPVEPPKSGDAGAPGAPGWRKEIAAMLDQWQSKGRVYIKEQLALNHFPMSSPVTVKALARAARAAFLRNHPNASKVPQSDSIRRDHTKIINKLREIANRIN